jgi:hypothetical protein
MTRTEKLKFHNSPSRSSAEWLEMYVDLEMQYELLIKEARIQELEASQNLRRKVDLLHDFAAEVNQLKADRAKILEMVTSYKSTATACIEDIKAFLE